MLDKTVHNAVNRTLKIKGKKLANKGVDRWYWSSTEYDYKFRSGEFCAWYVHMTDGYTNGSIKSVNNYVRAVAAF